MCPLDRGQIVGQDIWSSIIIGFLLGSFTIRIILEKVDWVKQIAIPRGVGLIQLNIWIEEKKKTEPPLSKEDFFLSDCLQTGTLAFFLLSDSAWNIGSSWVSSLLSSRLKPHHQLSWVSSLPIHPEDPELANLHNHISLFLIIFCYFL